MNLLQLQLPWLPHPLGAMPALVWVIAFCTAVDFVKLLVELLGRAEDRRFLSDPGDVTAIIPSHNGAHMLPATIKELRGQIPPERTIVMDDGSTDDTEEVARALGCRVYRFERSKGKASAINFAVFRVSTPYTLLLDDDTRMGNARIPTQLLSEGACDGGGVSRASRSQEPERLAREQLPRSPAALRVWEVHGDRQALPRHGAVDQLRVGSGGAVPHRGPERAPPRAHHRFPGRGPAAHDHPPAARQAHRVRERAGVDGRPVDMEAVDPGSDCSAGTRASTTSSGTC
jgi:hypothetical protein